jgi:hypothetical protein
MLVVNELLAVKVKIAGSVNARSFVNYKHPQILLL